MSVRTKPILIAVPALLATSLGLSLGPGDRPADDPFPTPSKGMTLSGVKDQERGVSLRDLVLEFAEVTGEHLIWTNEADALLMSTTLRIDRDLEVAPEEVYTVVETVLAVHEFVLIDLRRKEPRMMSIVSRTSSRRGDLKAWTRYVREDELERYEAHPAIMITTLVRFEHLDLRTLTNSLRQSVTDPNTEMIIPILDSRQLIVMGFGSWVVDRVRMLRDLDEAAAGAGGK